MGPWGWRKPPLWTPPVSGSPPLLTLSSCVFQFPFSLPPPGFSLLSCSLEPDSDPSGFLLAPDCSLRQNGSLSVPRFLHPLPADWSAPRLLRTCPCPALPSRPLTVCDVWGPGYQEGFPGVAFLGLRVPEEPGVDGLRGGLGRVRGGLIPRPPPPPGWAEETPGSGAVHCRGPGRRSAVPHHLPPTPWLSPP
jgi:hypothetical protein